MMTKMVNVRLSSGEGDFYRLVEFVRGHPIHHVLDRPMMVSRIDLDVVEETPSADHRDGHWHGWNGGECPVEPGDEVEAVFLSLVRGGIDKDRRPASLFDWDAKYSNIVAFRVVSRAPREYTDEDGVTWREVVE